MEKKKKQKKVTFHSTEVRRREMFTMPKKLKTLKAPNKKRELFIKTPCFFTSHGDYSSWNDFKIVKHSTRSNPRWWKQSGLKCTKVCVCFGLHGCASEYLWQHARISICVGWFYCESVSGRTPPLFPELKSKDVQPGNYLFMSVTFRLNISFPGLPVSSLLFDL